MSIIEFRRTLSPEKLYYEISVINFNSEINIFIHSIAFFFTKAHNVYKFYKFKN